MIGVSEKPLRQPVIIHPVSVQATLPLRHSVLRPHASLDECLFPEDKSPDASVDARHWAAVLPAAPETVIGCLSAYRQTCPVALPVGKTRTHWRLRGMAVLPPFQGKGIGKRLLEKALADVSNSSPDTLVWCNARESALGFYRQAGFSIHGARFEIPAIGPHFLMWSAG